MGKIHWVYMVLGFLMFGFSSWAMIREDQILCGRAFGEPITLSWARNIRPSERKPKTIPTPFAATEGLHSVYANESFSVAVYGHARWVRENTNYVKRQTGMDPDEMANDVGRYLTPQQYGFENGFVVYDSSRPPVLHLEGREADIYIFLKRFKSEVFQGYLKITMSFYPDNVLASFDLTERSEIRRFNSLLRTVRIP